MFIIKTNKSVVTEMTLGFIEGLLFTGKQVFTVTKHGDSCALLLFDQFDSIACA